MTKVVHDDLLMVVEQNHDEISVQSDTEAKTRRSAKGELVEFW